MPSRSVISVLLLLAAVFNTIAAATASVCIHPDGSRNVELAIAPSECHAAPETGGPLTSQPAVASCDDERLRSNDVAGRREMGQRIDVKVAPCPVLPYRLPVALDGDGVRLQLPSPAHFLTTPNTPPGVLSTVVLLV